VSIILRFSIKFDLYLNFGSDIMRLCANENNLINSCYCVDFDNDRFCVRFVTLADELSGY
jgi:hypothetical protein